MTDKGVADGMKERCEMRNTRGRTYRAAALWAAAFLCPALASAQVNTNAGGANNLTQMDGSQAVQALNEKMLTQTLGDPREDAAYQAFHKISVPDADKKIRVGTAFLNKYPSDRYSEAVYEELSQAYYTKKDLPSFYTCSDKGISLFPDDVYLLALSGWVIPRAFDPKDPDADKKLDRAEAYERHALDVLDKMPKPMTFTDEQFAQFKKGEIVVAHSGLGLIYFRREDYENSAKELEASTAATPSPDPTDLFVLGADKENTGKWKEAADLFNRCSQAAGPMQAQCKDLAANAQKHAAEDGK
jgi:tetratricopeptide (TPR) repeat protein